MSSIFDPLNNLFVTIFNGIHTFIHGVIPNDNFSYGIAIIVFTLLVKLALLPLNLKSMKSTAKTQQIQPQMEAVRTKYKNNPQKMNEEVMKLYKDNNVSMFGGCLPLLLQWPVLLAMFFVFRNLNLQGVTFLGFDLGLPPPGFGEMLKGHFTLNSLLPLIFAGTQFITMKMMPSMGTEEQKKQTQTMNIGMTIFLLVMCYQSGKTSSFTGAFLIYWIVSNLIQLAQTYAFKKMGMYDKKVVTK